MNKRNIWIDADPGIDDASAFALALANRDRLNVLGISTVAGNQTLDNVTANACKLTVFLGAEDVPVARGAGGPLLRELIDAADIHGPTGLGYGVVPATDKKEVSCHAAAFMYETFMGLPAEEKLTLVATGPLTNVALLLKTFPDVKQKLEQIVLMGGAAVGGNITPTAEFNIWEDPEAAKIVYSAGVPIVMCGLDVTHQCGLDREQVAALVNSGGRVQTEYGKMLQFYFDSPAYLYSEIVSIHDTATIMYLLEPDMFRGERMHVQIDCSEGFNRGMTVCDMRKERETGTEGMENALVLTGVDQSRFQERLLDAFASYDRA